MYSLDINLLSERAEYQTGKQTNFGDHSTTGAAPAKYSNIPLFVGIGVAALSLLATGGGYLWMGHQTNQLEAKQTKLDQTLGSLKVQEQRLNSITAQVTQVTNESQSLSSVLNQVQPWSAVLQDLRENIPQGVQVASVIQTELNPPTPPVVATAPVTPSSGGLINKISTPPNPEASLTPGAVASTPKTAPAAATATAALTPAAPIPTDVPITKIDIVGTAKSFDEVNNFILTLKKSAFFNPDDTHIQTAKLLPAMVFSRSEPIGSQGDKPTRVEFPKLVGYKIQTSLKRVPSVDLIRELERKGAVGLVTRLRTLQQQQAKP